MTVGLKELILILRSLVIFVTIVIKFLLRKTALMEGVRNFAQKTQKSQSLM